MDLKKLLKMERHSRDRSRVPLIGSSTEAMDGSIEDFSERSCSINCTTEDLQFGDSHREPQTIGQTRDQTRDRTRAQFGLQTLDQETQCEHLGLNLSGYSYSSGQISVDQAEEIQEFTCSHLPEPPSDLDRDPQRHLLAVQTVVQRELLRLAPLLKVHGLMGVQTQSFHRAVFMHMKELLTQSSSSRTCLHLLRWVLTKYFSQELFLHPDLQTLDLLQNMDLVLLSDWIKDAQDKLFSLFKADVSSQLHHILDRERQHQPCRSEQDFNSTYVDVIQCIDAAPTVACRFSPQLSLKLMQVCLNELLVFVQSYKTQWFEWMETLTKKKMADREMLQFFRTLNICTKLKEYISNTRLRWTEFTDIVEQIMVVLEETEAFTLKVLLDTVTAFTESGLKRYFRSNHRDCFLMTDMERLFRPEPWLSLEEHKSTMDRCYWRIALLYSKHLMNHRLHRLEQSWSPAVPVSESVSEDAQLIHKIMTSLCPNVEEWNFLLHFISDLLETKELDAIKLSAGTVLHKCKENHLTEDMLLLPGLLKWKGMSKSDIDNVLDTLQGVEPNLVLSQPWYRSCFG